MEVFDNSSVGEEGKDFVTLPVVSNQHNPNIGDIYLSHRCYYLTSDRHPVVICVNGQDIFTDQLELYVKSISYYEPKPGALLLIGEIRDMVEGRFFEVVVFYFAHDVALERTGRMRVYLPKEEENLVGTPEEISSFFGPITTAPIG